MIYVATLSLGIPLFTVEYQAVFAFAPAPAAIDWLAQSLGRRESTTRSRLISGTLLGAGFADAAALLITQRWILVLGALGIYAGYVLLLLSILRWTGAWRAVIAEHFPQLER